MVNQGDLRTAAKAVRMGKDAAGCNNGVSADSSFFASKEKWGIVAASDCCSSLCIGLTASSSG